MYRILIVEDDRGIAAAIKAQAEMWSLKAVCAEDFRDVLGEFAIKLPTAAIAARTPFFTAFQSISYTIPSVLPVSFTFRWRAEYPPPVGISGFSISPATGPEPPFCAPPI